MRRPESLGEGYRPPATWAEPCIRRAFCRALGVPVPSLLVRGWSDDASAGIGPSLITSDDSAQRKCAGSRGVEAKRQVTKVAGPATGNPRG
jgi:hypothetical protein